MDILVGKLDENGNTQWAKRFGGPGEQHAAAVAMDSAGNVVVTGYFYESMDFSIPPQVAAGALDLFIMKLAP